jgi:hypothetical protein
VPKIELKQYKEWKYNIDIVGWISKRFPQNLTCSFQNKTVKPSFVSRNGQFFFMRFEVLTAVKMTMLFLWVVMSYRLVGRYQRFGETALNMETVCFSETLVSTYESTRHNPEDQHRQFFFSISV